MGRLCERPGCSEPGAAAYGMVPEDLLFWVAPLDKWVDHQTGVLCRRHADAMVVPRGWTLDDRREPVPRLFKPAPTGGRDDTGATERPRRRRPAGTPDAGAQPHQLRLDDEAATAAGGERPAAVDAASDAPPSSGDVGSGGPDEVWRPAFDVDDDLDGLLEVDSPLLARAFRGTGRPKR